MICQRESLTPIVAHQMETVSIGAMTAAYEEPVGPGPHPGIVVLHEMWGLNDDIRGIVGRLAGEGYATVAPDLYSVGVRAICIARTVADMVRGGSRTLGLIGDVRQWLRERPSVDEARLGVIGFCMGGGFALLAGVRDEYRAASVNYGAVPKKVEALEGVCPVVGSYGRLDRQFAPQAERLERFLTDLRVPHDVKIYPNAGHSFLNQTKVRISPPRMAAGYKEGPAEDAWRRILGFFRDHVAEG